MVTTPTQDPLFFDGWEDAVRQCAFGPGTNPKEVAAAVWPNLSPERSYDRLKHGTDPNRRETLSLDEIIQIMRVTERFYPLQYMAQECHHSRPVPMAPEDEKARLQAEFVKAAGLLKTLAVKIENL